MWKGNHSWSFSLLRQRDDEDGDDGDDESDDDGEDDIEQWVECHDDYENLNMKRKPKENFFPVMQRSFLMVNEYVVEQPKLVNTCILNNFLTSAI